jgi:polysaccharide deacetylase family protein (PEP-CTERM system associated)
VTTPCLLTFDIEDWFQVENLRPLFPPERWDEIPRRVQIGTRVILDLLARHDIRATFFVLGWIAEREPALVEAIAAAGHEVASHGYGHVLPMTMPALAFRDDILRGRKALEELVGRPVHGYRAPAFSLDAERLAIVATCGYRYDSSHHPLRLHDRYGDLGPLGAPLRPGVYRVGGLVELGLPVERLGPLPLPVSGGGYFRLYPGALFRGLARRSIARWGHAITYLHAWEFDPAQPRVRGVGRVPAFRHYHGLGRTRPRLERFIVMLRDAGARFLTCGEFVDEVAG